MVVLKWILHNGMGRCEMDPAALGRGQVTCSYSEIPLISHFII
jgi:hypothetical protein